MHRKNFIDGLYNLGYYTRMVHPGGFEPQTARFVAEYSIQLSYGCILEFLYNAECCYHIFVN